MRIKNDVKYTPMEANYRTTWCWPYLYPSEFAMRSLLRQKPAVRTVCILDSGKKAAYSKVGRDNRNILQLPDCRLSIPPTSDNNYVLNGGHDVYWPLSSAIYKENVSVPFEMEVSHFQFWWTTFESTAEKPASVHSVISETSASPI